MANYLVLKWDQANKYWPGDTEFKQHVSEANSPLVVQKDFRYTGPSHEQQHNSHHVWDCHMESISFEYWKSHTRVQFFHTNSLNFNKSWFPTFTTWYNIIWQYLLDHDAGDPQILVDSNQMPQLDN